MDAGLREGGDDALPPLMARGALRPEARRARARVGGVPRRNASGWIVGTAAEHRFGYGLVPLARRTPRRGGEPAVVEGSARLRAEGVPEGWRSLRRCAHRGSVRGQRRSCGAWKAGRRNE